jgi:deaminated glutathione amidase
VSGVFTAACIQLTSGRDIAPNIAAASDLVRRARDKDALFIMTPEVSDMIEPRRGLRLEKAVPESEHAMLAAFRDLARETRAWLLLGSIVVREAGDDERLRNRSLLIAPDGAVAARYDKIHMFDVALEGGESYRESAAFRPGERAVLAPLPWGVLGMTVCYDLRFPHLYRALAQKGAQFLTIPSAFTVPTGRAHWHVLLRARAIENFAFVFAPAQSGEHAEGRRTYGHSLVVAPWGEVLAEAEDGPGFITAVIDPAKAEEARRAVPSLGHDRPFGVGA